MSVIIEDAGLAIKFYQEEEGPNNFTLLIRFGSAKNCLSFSLYRVTTLKLDPVGYFGSNDVVDLMSIVSRPDWLKSPGLLLKLRDFHDDSIRWGVWLCRLDEIDDKSAFAVLVDMGLPIGAVNLRPQEVDAIVAKISSAWEAQSVSSPIGTEVH